jgi:ferredoxin
MQNNLQNELCEAIRRFTVESSSNRMPEIDDATIFDTPLVGFAAGDDPLFEQYHTLIGEFHQTPRQVLGLVDEPVVNVVVWILPITKETRLSNRVMKEGCSLPWNHTRFLGEDFNDEMRRLVVQFLEERGYKAVAPVLAGGYKQVRLTNGLATNWSERHAAYAAGLGTFGLSDGLITERGIAHRVGSVVCTAPFEPMRRPYSHHQEYCRNARDGSCGECIRRCPAGALSASGHDKIKCESYLFETLKPWRQKPGYMGDGYVGCGLCQTGVPCEHRIPD